MVKVPMKVGGGFKQNVSLKQGAQVLTATQRAETTTRRRHHPKKFSGELLANHYTCKC